MRLVVLCCSSSIRLVDEASCCCFQEPQLMQPSVTCSCAGAFLLLLSDHAVDLVSALHGLCCAFGVALLPIEPLQPSSCPTRLLYPGHQ